MKITPKQIILGTLTTGIGVYLYHTHQKKKKKAGLILDELQKKIHPETKGVSSMVALDPRYVDRVQQQVSGVIVLHPNSVDRYAKELHKAFKPFYYGGDDEQAIYNVLSKLKDKVQVSQIAKQYQTYDTIGLRERIQSNLDTTEIKKVLHILNSLEEYRTHQGKSTIEPNWKDPFDMKYTSDVIKWLDRPVKRMPIKTLKELALKIKNAPGLFDDDEEVIKTIFQKVLQDKTQVSDLSAVFYNDHKEDLWKYLRDFLNDDEMKHLVTIPVAKLPNYKLI